MSLQLNPSSSAIINKGRWLRLFLLLIVIAIALYLFSDYKGPGTIALKNDKVFGFNCLRTNDLVVQEYDREGNLWASRGMKIYMLENGKKEFTRIAHVPTGLTLLWLRDFTLVRKILLRPECIEMVVCNSGDISALSAGKMWFLKKGEKKFSATFHLAHYGFGDQGVRNDGILSTDDNTVYYGEYFQNSGRQEVNILRSGGIKQEWKSAFEFKPGEIRHIHAIQRDPYTGKLWVCTGDADEESFIAWSDDEFRTIHKIGEGSQLWRVCQLVFTEDAIFFGTDNGEKEISGIYRWDKTSFDLKKLESVPGAVFFATRLKSGTIAMSTNRENMANETDDKVRLYLTPAKGSTKVFECGSWHHKKKGFWFKYAMLRFQRNQDSHCLAISCLNQKELPDSELLIIPEESLIEALGKN